MENKTFVQKLNALQYDVTHFLCTEFHNMSEYWKESKHYSHKVLKIKKENVQFNLDGNRYLTEFDGGELIDDQGYKYNLNVLSIDDLCILADAIKKRNF